MKLRLSKIAFISLFLFFFSFFTLSVPPVQAAPADLVITEIMYNLEGADDPHEWVEFYNQGNENITLVGGRGSGSWRFYDGSNHILNIETIIISPGQYFILADDDQTFLADHSGFVGTVIDTVISLNNTLDTLSLINPDGNVIDSVTYRNSWGGNGDGKSLEKIDINGGNTAGNWGESQTQGGTPGAINSISGQQIPPEPEPEPVCQPTAEICDGIDNNCDGQIDEGGVCEVLEPPTSQTKTITYSSNIFINEFLPSPEGPDIEEEFIEFFNSNATSVDLSGWKIEDTQGSTKVYIFPNGVSIESYGFLVLNRPTSKIVLNNDGEGLILKNPLGSVVDSAFYEGKAPEGQSYARKTDGVWEWTLVLTAGGENSFPIIAETESEIEPELGSQLEPQTTKEPSFDSSSAEASEDKKATEDKPQPKPTVYPFGILINEILPSPTGPDAEEEWIEIFNKNNFKVNISGWQIRDIRGKTKTYIFPEGTKISPQSFLVLSRKTSKITLNNDGDGLNLVLPNGEIRDQVSYEKAPTGKSYNRTDSGWDWSDTLTPGSENIIPAQIIKEEEEKEEAGGAAEIPEKGLAGISQSFPKSSRGLFVLLVALGIAIFSGIIVLILKRKIKTE